MSNWFTRLLGSGEQETTGPVEAELQEALRPPFSDMDEHLTAAQMGSAYVRRLTKQPKRDLQPLEQERMVDVAAWLRDSNPLAKRIVEMTESYVLGEGVEIEAMDDDKEKRVALQAQIDRFWDDPVNDLDTNLHDWVTDLGTFGELCLVVATNPVSGHVRLGYMDPGSIDHIEPNPSNPFEWLSVALRGAPGEDPRRLRLVHLDETPGTKWPGRLVGVNTDAQGQPVDAFWWDEGKKMVPYRGAAFFLPVNRISGSSRGRSDLLTMADWIDAYDQLLFGEVDRSILMKSHIWDVELIGADEGTIEDYMKKHGPPKPGSVRAHNDKVKWQAVTPDLKQFDAAYGADLIHSLIATGAGSPKNWLNGVLEMNRAVSNEMSEPAYKRLTTRQLLCRGFFRRMVTFALDQAEMRGILETRPKQQNSPLPEPWKFVIHMPELRPKDLKMLGDAFMAVMQGLAIAMSQGMIDDDTAQDVVRLMVKQLGIEVDVEAMRVRIKAKAEELKAELALQLPTSVSQPKTNGNGTEPKKMPAVKGGTM